MSELLLGWVAATWECAVTWADTEKDSVSVEGFREGAAAAPAGWPCDISQPPAGAAPGAAAAGVSRRSSVSLPAAQPKHDHRPCIREGDGALLSGMSTQWSIRPDQARLDHG